MQGSWDPWSTSKLNWENRLSIMRVCGKQSILRYQSDDIFISFTKCYLWLWADYWKQFPKQRKKGGILTRGQDKENFSWNGSLFLQTWWLNLALLNEKSRVFFSLFGCGPKHLSSCQNYQNELVNCFGHSNHLIEFLDTFAVINVNHLTSKKYCCTNCCRETGWEREPYWVGIEWESTYNIADHHFLGSNFVRKGQKNWC